MFKVLGWVLFGWTVFEGLRLTTSQLSRERREDTLGLLFLTRLRGVEVVQGKLAAASVQSVYGLVATFPVLTLPLMLGGVGGGQVLRAQAVLLVTLFLVAAVGLWASSRHAEDGRALREACVVFFGLTLVLSLPSLLGAGSAGIGLLSPIGSMSLALGAVGRPAGVGANVWVLWIGLGLQSVAALRFVRLAARNVLTVRDGIREAPARDLLAGWRARTARWRRQRWAFGEEDPGRWLSVHTGLRGRAWMAGLFPVLWAVLMQGIPGFLGMGPGGGGFWIVIWLGNMLFQGGLLCLLAAGAVRMVTDARGSGAIELLLPTAMGPHGVAAAFWRAAWLSVRTPVVVSSLLLVGISLMGATDRLGAGVSSGRVLLHTVWVLPHALQILAICGTGLWLGLTQRRPLTAVGLTLLMCGVVPWVLNLFLSRLPVIRVWFQGRPELAWVELLPVLAPAGVVASCQLGWILLARRRFLEADRRWTD